MKKLSSAESQRLILAKNLKNLLTLKNKTQANVIKELDLPEATVRSWFNGEKYPRLDKIQMLADYFNVPRSTITESPDQRSTIKNNIVKVPILKEKNNKRPIFNKQNFIGYQDELAHHMPAGILCYMTAPDDSMLPTIPKHSQILFQKQQQAKNGELVVVATGKNNNLLLKRVYYQKETTLFTSDHADYPPLISSADTPITVIGKVVSVTFRL